MVWQKYKWVASAVLLGMILVRLVWLQIRSYDVQANERTLAMIQQVSAAPECSVPAEDPLGIREFAVANANVDKFSLFSNWGTRVFLESGCQESRFDPSHLVRFNQWLYVTTVVIACLIARILTRSWILTLIAAVTLLSRGNLLADLGTISSTNLLMFFVTLWLGCCVHFFRSAAVLSVALSLLLVMMAMSFNPAILILCFVLPILVVFSYLMRRLLSAPLLRRLYSEKERMQAMIDRGKLRFYRGGVFYGVVVDSVNKILGVDNQSSGVSARENQDEGTILGVLNAPFILWVLRERRWLKLVVCCSGFGFALLVGFVVYKYHLWQTNIGWTHLDLSLGGRAQDWLGAWIGGVFEGFDTHLSLSFLLILLSMIQSPADGLVSFFETCWLVFISLLVLGFALGVADFVDAAALSFIGKPIGEWTVAMWGHQRDLISWFEPVILVLGLSAIYHLLIISNSLLKPKKLK